MKRYTLVPKMNPDTHKFITKNVISKETVLNYLIIIPCVNRLERNAVNIIERTFQSFENGGVFTSKIKYDLLLLESGSYDLSYLYFLNKIIEKYPNLNIQLSRSPVPLDGYGNTYRMFYYIDKNKYNYDYVIWMDDDIYVCKNFLENADSWIKKYANFSLFSSLYVPYKSVMIRGQKYCQLASLPTFFGTCCVVLKPGLAKYMLPHFMSFTGYPDFRFRKSILHYFPGISGIVVSYPSLVQHIGIGSSIYKHKKTTGHKAKNFIGEDKDPKYYQVL
jgi:hypothetical protein